jgi:hypothetical protein
MGIMVERGFALIRNTISPILFFLAYLCFYLSILGLLIFVAAFIYYKFIYPKQ